MIPEWLRWARELQSIAQNGITFSQNEFEIERYHTILDISAQMIALHSDADKDTLVKMFIEQAGYATPKIDVRGVAFRDNKILLVKEKADGRWTLPGGWADPNETPSQSIEREVFEESGYKVRAVKLLALYDRDAQGHFPPYPFHIYKAFFLCEIYGGERQTSNETDGVDFFEENDIPPLSEARVRLHQLNHFFSQYRTGKWETAFD